MTFQPHLSLGKCKICGQVIFFNLLVHRASADFKVFQAWSPWQSLQLADDFNTYVWGMLTFQEISTQVKEV